MAKRQSPPTFTDEARRNQLINLAYDLAEQRLRDGTATSQEVTTFLRMGQERTSLELEIMRAERDLAVAKAEAIRKESENQDLMREAIRAMSIYNGEMPEEEMYDTPN